MRGLKGQVAIVTGGGGGLGAATVHRLAQEGAQVVVVDLDLDAATAVADSAGNGAVPVAADVATESGVTQYMAAAVEAFGRVDLHHLNAGIGSPQRLFPDVPVEDFDKVMGVNVRGVFLGMRAAFQQYTRQGSGGAMVATASICSFGGAAQQVPYQISKHALVGLMQSAAVYGGPHGVRVNAVAPGRVPTNMAVPTEEATAAGIPDYSPLRRWGKPEEIASVVAFLLSDEASFVSGSVYSADGGAIAMNPLVPYDDSDS